MDGNNEYHERGVDLSEVGLCGSLKPAYFGWEEQDLPNLEKEGFTIRRNILVKHYELFHKNYPSGHWMQL